MSPRHGGATPRRGITLAAAAAQTAPRLLPRGYPAVKNGTQTTALKRRAVRALQRQLEHQSAKAARIREQGLENRALQLMQTYSASVRDQLERFRPALGDARVLEVGSGAHGLVFCFGGTQAVGCDPLAAEYRSLFPAWQGRVPTLAAAGERLPFPDAAFDVVLCDNVVDHAERPAEITAELVRVLSPGGLLYFTVNFHHPFYHGVSWLLGRVNALGIPFEVGPFADHTVHLTLRGAKRLFRGLPLRVLDEESERRGARGGARRAAAAWAVALVRRLFFKNAAYRLIAERL
jgi:SAM-dependent methyltransferase